MTREEAIELLCYGDWLNVISKHIGKTDTERIAEAMSIVGKALRPVSREQVEKVWRAHWNESVHLDSSFSGRHCNHRYVCKFHTAHSAAQSLLPASSWVCLLT